MVRRATCFITAWLGVRLLPAPPRTLVLTEISRNQAISPELAELPSVILPLKAGGRRRIRNKNVMDRGGVELVLSAAQSAAMAWAWV